MEYGSSSHVSVGFNVVEKKIITNTQCWRTTMIHGSIENSKFEINRLCIIHSFMHFSRLPKMNETKKGKNKERMKEKLAKKQNDP